MNSSNIRITLRTCDINLSLLPTLLCRRLCANCVCVCVCVCVHGHAFMLSHARLCNPLRVLYPWDSPGKNTGVGSHFLLQWISPTQVSNPQSPALAGGFFITSGTWKLSFSLKNFLMIFCFSFQHFEYVTPLSFCFHSFLSRI